MRAFGRELGDEPIKALALEAYDNLASVIVAVEDDIEDEPAATLLEDAGMHLTGWAELLFDEFGIDCPIDDCDRLVPFERNEDGTFDLETDEDDAHYSDLVKNRKGEF